MNFGKKEKVKKIRSLHRLDDESLPEVVRQSEDTGNSFYAKQNAESKELGRKIKEKEERDQNTEQKHSLFYGKYDTFKTALGSGSWYQKFTFLDKIILGIELLLILYGILILLGLLPLF